MMHLSYIFSFVFFFFKDTATTEIYTLSLHDALPISRSWSRPACCPNDTRTSNGRSEEHTSELQSRENLVCRLLLETKKNNIIYNVHIVHTNDTEGDAEALRLR